MPIENETAGNGAPQDQDQELLATGDEGLSNETGGTPAHAADAEAADGEKRQSRGRKRLERLKRQREEARREAAEAKAELERLRASQGGGGNGPPDPDNFENNADYWQALDEWREEGGGKKPAAKANGKAGDSASQAAEVDQDAVETIMDAIDESERSEDIKKAFLSDNLQISPAMISAIADADDPAQVADYLGANPKVAASLAAMPDWKLALAIPDVEKASRAKPGQGAAPGGRRSSAPDPINPTKGAKGVQNFDPTKATFKEYEAWRQQQQGRRPTGWI